MFNLCSSTKRIEMLLRRITQPIVIIIWYFQGF